MKNEGKTDLIQTLWGGGEGLNFYFKGRQYMILFKKMKTRHYERLIKESGFQREDSLDVSSKQ